MIVFACTECGKRLEVKDEHAGKKAKCPGCGAVVAVPHESTDREQAAEQVHGERAGLDDLAAAVRGTRGRQSGSTRPRRKSPSPSHSPDYGAGGYADTATGSRRQHVVIHRPPTNGLGVAGFVVSLVGLILGGLICPIGLVLSAFGMRRQPRGLAITGLILGIVGSLWIVVALVFLSGIGALSCIGAGLSCADRKRTAQLSNVQQAPGKVRDYEKQPNTLNYELPLEKGKALLSDVKDRTFDYDESAFWWLVGMVAKLPEQAFKPDEMVTGYPKLLATPSAHRGKPVTIRGAYLTVTPFTTPVLALRKDIPTLYECNLRELPLTEERPIATVIVIEDPMTYLEVYDTVRVKGYFYKVRRYKGTKGEGFAPMLVARRLVPEGPTRP